MIGTFEIPYHKWTLQYIEGTYKKRNIKSRKKQSFPLGAYKFELVDGSKYLAYFHYQTECIVVENIE